MGLARGADLATARGRLEIDASQPQTVPGIMQGVAQGISNATNQINASTNKATQGFTGLASAARGLAGAFGVSLGVQGLAQLARAAVAATDAATAYERQGVAARSLAGSQQRLNELLIAYDKASGGAVDKATALADVTRLLATGFAKNTGQLQQFVTAVRGASIAMGKSQEELTQEVQLAITNQSTKRLDQIGLGVAEVEQRIQQLRATNQGMTREAAFQAAVMGLLDQKYGDLARSAEGQKTSVEKARTAWGNLGLTLGQVLSGPINAAATGINFWLNDQTAKLQTFIMLLEAARKKLEEIGLLTPNLTSTPLGHRTSIGRVTPTALDPGATLEMRAVKLDWSRGISDLNRRTTEELLDQNEDYQRQRADSERNFQQATSRAAEDFGLQRQRQEQDLADSITRIHADAARREERMTVDLARGISRAQTDSEERMADARKDAAERLAELEEDYAKDREKRARDLSDKLLDAAGKLDAQAVYEAQRNAARQEEEAKESHDEQRDKLQEQLAERLDDERESLAKSIAQQREAYDRQLTDGREADAQRITDMQADFAKRREQEEYDYGERMARMAEDHNDQLAEMDRAHGERITQIQTHAAQERAQLDEEHKRALVELGVHNDAWIAEIKRLDDAALEELERFLYPIRVWAHDPTQPLVVAPDRLAGTSAAQLGAAGSGTSVSRNTSLGTVVVNIQGTTNMDEAQLRRVVVDAITEALESMP